MPRDISGLTLPGVLDQVAAESSHATILFPEERCSFAELAQRSRELAAGLIALGVGREDKVGILQMGGIDTVAMMIAAMRLGAWPVPINARYKSVELQFLAHHADLRVLVVDDVLSGVVVETLPTLIDHSGGPLDIAEMPELRYVLGGDSPPAGILSRSEFSAMAKQVDQAAVAAAEAKNAADDVCILLYTSGTTANPKGAMHSHSTILHQGANTAFNRFDLTPDDTFWSPLPLFHIGGIVVLSASIVAAPGSAILACSSPASPYDSCATRRPRLGFRPSKPSGSRCWIIPISIPRT